MSCFKMRAKHKATGETHEIWAMDDHFGKHNYGYIPNINGGKALTEEQFYQQYEEGAEA